MSSLKLYLLGPPRLERDGRPVAVPLRRALAVLVYLAVTGLPQSRETVAALLWPESDEPEARGRLRRTLHRLGDAVGARVLIADASTLRLAPEADLWVDCLAFREHASAGLAVDAASDALDADRLDHLARAAALYGDDFLAGFALPDSAAWEEWQFHQREGLRQTCARVLERLTWRHRGREEWEAAIGFARRWLALDSLHEPAHRALMELYARAGQQAAALRQYQECVRLLETELGVAPEDETRRLYEEIRTRRLVPADDGARPLVAAGRHPAAGNNLPPQATSFVGRARELSTLRQLLLDEPVCRLVTLVGPGGIGKTRLALEAAATSAGDFPDGVFFVPLSPLVSTDHLVSTLAEHVGFRFYRADEPKRQLLGYLRDKRALLVLDNFEHLIEGADLLPEILAAAPRVKLLVTSRERLNLSSEAVYTVGGMVVPDDASSRLGFDRDAVHLLVDRARLVRPDLTIRDDDLAPIVRICRLVEGMPLAIELAAGWLEALSFAEIADEIARGLDFLESQARDLPARQRSVRATFDHSWTRLSAEQQQTFARLTVFRGGFTRRAAEAVTGAGPRDLRALVNRSFLSVDAGGRYQIHELLRQYGGDHLQAFGAAEPTRDAHCSFFADLLRQRERDLHGGGQVEALNAIETDLDNIRAAWEWALHRGDDTAVGRSAEALHLFFTMRSRYDEGARLFCQARERLSRRPSPARAHLLSALAFMDMMANPAAPDAAANVEEGLAIAYALGDRREIAFALFRTGCFHFVVNRDVERAESCFRQSLDLFRAVDEPFYVANVLHWRGECYGRATNLETLADYSREGLEIALRTGNLFIASNLLGRLLIVALGMGDYEAAERYGREALSIQDTLKHNNGVADSKAQLALVRLLCGELDDALAMGGEAYAVAQKVNYPLFIAQALAVLALRAATAGDYDLARQLGEESLAVSTGSFIEVVLANWALAVAQCGLEDYAAAAAHLRAALSPARELRLTGMILWPLAVAPVVLAARGERKRAVELIGLISSHCLSPTGWLDAWQPLTVLGTQLREELGTETFAAAWNRGTRLDLTTAADAM